MKLSRRFYLIRKIREKSSFQVCPVFDSNPNLDSISKLLLNSQLRFEKSQKNEVSFSKIVYTIFVPILNLDSGKNILSFYKLKFQKSEKNEITFLKIVCCVFCLNQNFVLKILFLLNYYLKFKKEKKIGVSKFVVFLFKKEISIWK